jgi:hypothetical protein
VLRAVNGVHSTVETVFLADFPQEASAIAVIVANGDKRGVVFVSRNHDGIESSAFIGQSGFIISVDGVQAGIMIGGSTRDFVDCNVTRTCTVNRLYADSLHQS